MTREESDINLAEDEIKQLVNFVMILRKIDRITKAKKSQDITEQNSIE